MEISVQWQHVDRKAGEVLARAGRVDDDRRSRLRLLAGQLADEHRTADPDRRSDGERLFYRVGDGGVEPRLIGPAQRQPIELEEGTARGITGGNVWRKVMER